MRYKILSILLLFVTYLHANNKDDYVEKMDITYINLDNSLNFNLTNGVYSPFLSIGFRQIYEKNALDWNLGLELYPLIKSKFDLISFSVNCNYLKYFKKNSKNNYYYGIGGSILGCYTPKYCFLLKSPTFLIGKQINEKNHYYILQLKINWPNYPTITINSYKYRIPKIQKNQRVWSANIFATTGIGF